MNWIERIYDIKGKDLYSQNSEGLILEYIFSKITPHEKYFIDIGCGDKFILSNTRHLVNLGWSGIELDKVYENEVTVENILNYLPSLPDNFYLRQNTALLSIDVDGNDYWIIQKILTTFNPWVIIAEFNAMYTDSRTIKYNPDHEWAGDSYYGFTFDAGVKLAEKHGYKVIFQIADMNMIMVRADLIEGLTIPPVTFKQNDFFKLSERTDWIWI